MCILDFLKEYSSKSLSEKYQQQMMNKYNHDNVIHFNDNISMVEKGNNMLNNTLLANFILDRKKEFEAKSATFDFSSDDRERSSADEDNCSTGYNSTCTLCTSSFSFCNTSQRSFT